MTFGEFQREWNKVRDDRAYTVRKTLDRITRPTKEPSAMTQIFDSTVELFKGFHPARKPVLWRVLIAQYLLYRALLSGEPKVAPLTPEEVEMLDWRVDKKGCGDFLEPLTIAEEFVTHELTKLESPSH